MDDKELALLQRSALFAGIEPQALPGLLAGLAPVRRSYQKGEALLLAGDAAEALGIVLEGRISAERSAPDGTLLIINEMGAGGIFADVLSGSGSVKSPVTVTAAMPTHVLWLPYAHVLEGSGTAHVQLLRNLMARVTEKYFALDARVELLLCRSLRARILLYLQKDAPRGPDGVCALPFTRAGLAAYLGCERSALCRELSRMQRDGLIAVRGRFITLRAHS